MEKKIRNIILKIAGNRCNIECDYCFELPKVVESYNLGIDSLVKLIESDDSKISLTFHGGEPLIVGKKKFKNYLECLEKYYKLKKIESIKIQTNGTLLDEEWIKLLFEEFKELNIEIAISLDGNRIMNKHRIDKAGRETYESVLNAYKLLDKYQKKAGLLTVVSKNSLEHVEGYIKLLLKIPNIYFVKINPLYNITNNELTEDSITPKEYTDFIISFFKEYTRNSMYKKFAVEPILSILQVINNKSSRYCNYKTNGEFKCSKFEVVYPDLSKGICDCFSPEDYELEVSIKDKITKKNEEFMKEIEKLQNKCISCNERAYCNEACLSQRYYMRNNLTLSEEYCNEKKKLIQFFKRIKEGEKIE
ncbi:radical SAM protein [Cetobacterium sp.]|uniref:radical SAM protein n=1 Tax=Cetobacterium sp. TaxID=2071632 RepID=UPI003F33F38C